MEVIRAAVDLAKPGLAFGRQAAETEPVRPAGTVPAPRAHDGAWDGDEFVFAGARDERSERHWGQAGEARSGGALVREAGGAADHGDGIEAAVLAGPLQGGLDLDAEADAPDPLVGSYTSGEGGLGVESDFNITVNFEGTWTAELQARFILAAEYLSSLITGDLRDKKGIDDIAITATLSDIDGAGGILGQAGPTAYRLLNSIPFAGQMEFDVADAAEFDAMGLFDDIVIHEMLHTLGFGTMWKRMQLTEGKVFQDNMVFTGENAMSAFKALFPAIWNTHRNGIPVETDGGPGTAGGHWDDDTFGGELMTGYVSDVNYVSGMTVAALEDMGYQTVFDPAHPTASVMQPDDLLA